ncbi:Hypothetical predicted protein [Octopus vulgaris]|uniref:Uncharacterized protein n=1 Tax=Octopus vulgaris TaxID=6645 RepID=A0AA36BAG6_OCTVU|nr:Hypothetical predicted protein [Octopus vulgaris]
MNQRIYILFRCEIETFRNKPNYLTKQHAYLTCTRKVLPSQKLCHDPQESTPTSIVDSKSEEKTKCWKLYLATTENF